MVTDMAMEVIMSNDIKEKIPQGRKLIDISTVIDDFWNGFTRFWWLFLVLISLGASLLYFNAKKNYSPYYTASSTFTVTASAGIYFSESSYNQTAAAQMGKIFPYLLTSEVLNKIVAEDLGLDSVPGSVSASAMEDTNLVTIRVDASDPQMAYNILQSVLKNYPQVSEYVMGDVKLNLMDETGIPSLPTNMPAFKNAAVKGAAGGALISIVLLAMYALTRRTIRKEDDLKRILNVTCLGALPRAKFKRRGKVKEPLVLLDYSGIPHFFVEAVRTMRTRVERAMREDEIRSFLVTSAVAGEGKTTIASNLALSLTQRGYSVLLVDGDLRKPAVAKNMGLEKREKGFYDLLVGKASLEEVTHTYKGGKLKIIPGSSPVINTSRVLNGKDAAEVMEKLKNQADILIIDTPPSAVVSDAAIIAQYVQSGIFVVRQDYAKIDKILEGVEMLSGAGIRLSGCVLNDAVVGITGYGYGYGYGYGRYGYGKYGKYGKYGTYGYGVKEEEKQIAEQKQKPELKERAKPKANFNKSK